MAYGSALPLLRSMLRGFFRPRAVLLGVSNVTMFKRSERDQYSGTRDI